MKRGKKGQLFGMPFSVIFSIFLIIIFIIIAFIAIKHFLNIGRCGQVGLFYEDFQKEINRAWASQSSEFGYKASLPSEITMICFANFSAKITALQNYDKIEEFDYESNLFLIPAGEACNIPSKAINHLDIAKIILNKNPYCIDVSKELTIKKDFYDKLVAVEQSI